MHRVRWIGIILFLPIFFLWTSASTHAAPWRLLPYRKVAPMTRRMIRDISIGAVPPSTCTSPIAMAPHCHLRKVEYFVVPIVPSGLHDLAMAASPVVPSTAMFHTLRSWLALLLTQVWAAPCCGHALL